LEIIRINTRLRKDRNAFFKAGYDISKLYKTWHFGLKIILLNLYNPKQNPFLQETEHRFYLVKEKGKLLGRAALFGPGHLPFDNEAATFGFIDFIDNENVSNLIFYYLQKEAKKIGANKLIGPFNPNIHYSLGIQISGFRTDNFFMMDSNPDYYQRHYNKAGLEPFKPFFAWSLYRENYNPDPLFLHVLQKLEKQPNLKFRDLDTKHFDNDLALFYEMYCETFRTHWGFVAPSRKEFDFIAADLRYLLKPKMGVVAEWKGKPVGFVLSAPNLNEWLKKNPAGKIFPFGWINLLRSVKKIKTVRVMIAGVLPEYRNTGIHAVLFYRIAENIFEMGYDGGEISWVMEGNIAVEKTLKHLGAYPEKEYVLYQKDLT
jgi:GNAT superfamily N-acetyltransferase